MSPYLNRVAIWLLTQRGSFISSLETLLHIGPLNRWLKRLPNSDTMVECQSLVVYISVN